MKRLFANRLLYQLHYSTGLLFVTLQDPGSIRLPHLQVHVSDIHATDKVIAYHMLQSK